MNKWNIIAGLMVCMLWVGTLQAQEKKNNRRISQKLTLAEYRADKASRLEVTRV